MLTAAESAPEALEEVRRLLGEDPANPNYLLLEGNVLVQMGDHEQHWSSSNAVLASHPNQPRAQMNYGHTLKTVGRLDESIAAYRRCIALQPDIGDAYWSLANLKTYRFTDEQLALHARAGRRRAHAARRPLPPLLSRSARRSRTAANTTSRSSSTRAATRSRRPSPATVRTRARADDRAADRSSAPANSSRSGRAGAATIRHPIFIVGLPRAGSTLLEQILASHSQVEGTMELADIPRLVSALDLHASGARYPASSRAGARRTISAASARPTSRDTRHYRVGNTPFFIDKMPNNFRHVGLIHLMLPNAKIIDARREPMACCFSNFKQLFATRPAVHLQPRGHRPLLPRLRAADGSLGRVLPGRVLRVQHEDVIDDHRRQVRRLLDFCGLPFEQACGSTRRNARAHGQFRAGAPADQPRGSTSGAISRTHLGPLKEALGPVLERYPVE